ncbi:MAG TPA: phosphate ABC transporter permease subunit PstC [Streptosporangiaceae bacterium]|jgi:phosphate transport system permease protein|nr:phosphate ABC transporter permease subunit PstC [Streptosporangiaceae bacterium]
MAPRESVLSPEGEAGNRPLPRRVGSAVAGALRGDGTLRWTGRIVALLPALALLFILITLIVEAIPAIKYNGLGFFTKSIWSEGSFYQPTVTTNGVQHPQGAEYGAVPEIVGTILTSAIALIIAVPSAIGAALVIVERLPRRVSNVVGVFLELLAGIPSVVIGLWGALTFGPFIAHHIAPFIARNMPDVPVLRYFRGDTGNGQGLLVSGMILAVMVIPIVAATTRDLIRQVPILPREGAIALGMSDFETARRVTLPWVGGGIVGAVVLGLGRALGETIAVAMTCGLALGSIPSNIYAATTTIAATLVQTIETALQDSTGLAIKTLAELGLMLMIITLLTNVAARLLVRRVSGTALPVGRGL